MFLGLGYGFSQSQRPFLEQIAFDFYRTEIQLKYPIKKKIRVWKELKNATDDPYWFPRCLESFKRNGIDTLNQKISSRLKLDLSKLGKGQYRIKSDGKGKRPVVFVNKPFTIEGMNIIVNITELHKRFVNIYHIEIDKNGRILDWCKGGYVY